MALTRRSALALLAVAGLSGCSFSPIEWEEPTAAPEQTESVDPAVEVGSDFFVQTSDPGAKTLGGNSSVLLRFSTPHFDARLDSRIVADRLGEKIAAQARQSTAIKAAQGNELIAFVLEGGRPSFVESAEHAANVTLRVGGSVVPVKSPFGTFDTATRSYAVPWVMFVLSVPTGEPVHLQVEDEGQVVTVDIRSGTPVVDDGWKINIGFRERTGIKVTPKDAVFRRNLETVPPPEIQKQTAEFMLGVQPDASWGLVPWNPEDGWASGGGQWLRLKMNARTAFQSPDNVALEMRIDVTGSFTYEDSKGASHAALRPTAITTEAIRRGQGELDVTWQVSGQDVTAMVRCNPVGKIQAIYDNIAPVDAQFVSAADPLEFELAYYEVTAPW